MFQESESTRMSYVLDIKWLSGCIEVGDHSRGGAASHPILLVNCGRLMRRIKGPSTKNFQISKQTLSVKIQPPPPLSLTDSLDFSIQHRYLILILALVTHTYTIHTCIYTVYIPILYLFDTRILYFFTVLYFNKKYI